LNVLPLAFDSLGVRSMATFVETDDCRVLIDPGAHLAPLRYGLPPHTVEEKRLDELWEKIKQYAVQADVLAVTHYHYDHHDPDGPEVYKDKAVYIKHPTENINQSQRARAATFLEAVKGLPKSLEYADGRTFHVGKTRICFSRAVCHGTNPRLGYVTEVSVSHGGEKVVHTSDVEGPSLSDQIGFALKEKPQVLIVDGPMTYMLGFRYSYKSLEISNQNLVKAINKTDLDTLVIDHHFLRDLNYKARIQPVYEAAKARKVKVLTAAEYARKKVQMLEAQRKQLYEEYPDMETPRKLKKKLEEDRECPL